MKNNSDSVLTRTPVVCILAMICCLLWGSAFPCIKIGYQLFQIPADSIGSQLLFAGTRFTLAGVLTLLIGSLIRRQFLFPARGSWFMVGKLAMVQTVLQYILFYIGLANTTGVKSSIIEASNVFLAILAASLLFKLEKLTPAKVAGCILGFAGVVIINLNPGEMDARMSLAGEGCILLSATAYAFSSILIKRYSQKEDPVALSGYQFLFGGIVLTLIGSIMGGKLSGFTLSSVTLLLYMALISAVAYSLWGILLKHNPVGKVAVFGFMNPVFGVILSAVLLGESNQAFTLTGLAALVLVCLGIYVVNRN